MHIIIFAAGLFIGFIAKHIIENISRRIDKTGRTDFDVYIPFIFSICFEALYIRIGFNFEFIKAAAMTLSAVIVSSIDIKYRIIPDIMVLITLIIGIVLAFVSKASILDTMLAMLFGGGIMLLTALIPNAMGGGDIKFMFAVSVFLGFKRTLWAIMLAFILSSIVSVVLLVFKIKKVNDSIPFGPFLSIGSFISFFIFM